MPQTIKQEDGTEVEVFTAEELAAKADEKAREIAASEREELEKRHQEEKSELETQISEKDKALEESAEKLKKLEDKDFNFEQLRKAKGLSPEQEAEAKKVASEVTELRKTVDALKTQPLETAKSTFLESNFAPDDKDGREVFENYYKKLSSGATSLKEVNSALVAAFNATTGGTKPINNAAMLRTGVSEQMFNERSNDNPVSAEIASALGLNPEDKKTYGSVLKTGSVDLFAKPVVKK